MAITVTTDSVFFTGATTGISHGDTTADWTSSNTQTADAAQFVQGTASISNYVAAASSQRWWAFTSVATNITNKSIYFWFALGKVSFLNTKGAASGGLILTVESTAGNTGTWRIAGSDTLPHNGFICHAVDTTVAFDGGTVGSVNKESITKITITANGTFPGKAYLWVDALRLGTKLSITGGTSGSPASFSDFVTSEENVNNRYGILERINGVVFVQGKLEIGTTTQSQPTYFSDTSQVVVFKDSKFNPGFYNITMAGASAPNTTQTYLGINVGGKGVSGCLFRRASSTQAATYTVTATNSNVVGLGIYGCSFLYASDINLPTSSPARAVLSTNFEQGYEVNPSTCLATYSNFIGATFTDVGAVQMASTAAGISYCNFINCSRAIRFPVGSEGDYTFAGNLFTNNTVDVRNEVASGLTLTLSCLGTPSSNPTTHEEISGGNTEIINTKVLTLSGMSLSEIRIYESGTINEWAGTDLCASDTFQYPYSYAANTYVDIVIYRNDKLYWRMEDYLLLNADATLPVQQQFDRQYENP